MGSLSKVRDSVQASFSTDEDQFTRRLTAGLAHDFNNLLQSLMGGLEMLLQDLQGPSREYAEMALQSAEKGAELTHSLLAFSRQQVLQPGPVDLRQALTAAHARIGHRLGPDLTMTVHAALTSPTTIIDAGELESALVHLLGNAIDATGPSGRIALSAATAIPPPDTGLPPTDHTVIVVADTGPGMADAILKQACEPFFTTKGPRHSGLGLSMVQGFVSQSGGVLRIESTPGAGTRIELWFAPAFCPWNPKDAAGD